jgi:GTP-binding protein Era
VPVIIVLNKVDRLKPGHIATQMKTAAALGGFHAIHPVSAMTGDGIDELRGDLISLLPEGPMYYPADTDTDMALEARIAELVREQALRLTKEEIPHAITAEVVEIEAKHVHVRLYTETESQKQILIGKGGAMVREIGRGARPHIEALVGHAVYLQLQVKASPKWRRNETMLERLGL